MVEQEQSAGIIAYRNPSVPELILLHYPGGHWGFPKGHIEEGENSWQAAVRELEEETGLSVEKRDRNFRYCFDYNFRSDGDLIEKTVEFFSARVPRNESVTLSHEHEDYSWARPDQAMKILTYDNTKEMLSTWKTKIG